MSVPEKIELPLDLVDARAYLVLVDPEKKLYRLVVEAELRDPVLILGGHIVIRAGSGYAHVISVDELREILSGKPRQTESATADREEYIRKLEEENARLRQEVARLAERLKQIESLLTHYANLDKRLEETIAELRKLQRQVRQSSRTS